MSYCPDSRGTRIGLAALCASWFKEVGLQGEASELATTLGQDYARMVGCLSQCFGTVVAPGTISTVDEATRAVDAFRREGVEALLLVHIMWSEDQPLLALLEGCQGLPLLLWDYHPTGSLPARLRVDDLFRCSGTVGMLQGSAPLQRLGVAFDVVSGTPGDPDLSRALRDFEAALRIRKELLTLRAGRIAGRCEVMTGTFVDRGALRQGLGAELVEIEAEEYAAACEAVDPRRSEAFCADTRRQFPVQGVSEASLHLACRNTLALDDLVLRHDLGAVAIQDLDPTLHRLAGVRPCLCPPASAQRGVAFGMESDLNTTLGLLVGMRAAAAPAMFTEVFTYDPRENLLLMGHAGVHDPRLAGTGGVTIVPDAEYQHADRAEGAWQEFVLAPGPVTCISLYDTGHGYRLTTFAGESLGGPRRLQGFAHALVRPALPVRDLLRRLVSRGMTQHFAVAPGDIAGVLARWCRLAGVEFCLEA